jgi:hypothetical protein
MVNGDLSSQENKDVLAAGMTELLSDIDRANLALDLSLKIAAMFLFLPFEKVITSFAVKKTNRSNFRSKFNFAL